MIGLVSQLNDKLSLVLENKGIQRQASETEKYVKNLEKNMTKMSKIGQILSIRPLIREAKAIGKGLYSLTEDAVNASETYNLFAVSMGAVTDEYGNLDEASSKYYTKAMAFQDEMNQRLLTNKAELMEYQANYFSMLRNQIGNDDKAYEMSENLVKAGYDIASLKKLKNLDVSDAMNKLKSGLAGQVDSLRQIGIDVSESSLQSVLNDIGIDRKVQQLSYAEKEVARYIAIMRQASEAQGDFAKTMDQPANQIKMFKNQLAELRQMVGSFLTGVLGNILTYATAVVMVIQEVLKSIAGIFGIQLKGITGGLNGINDSVGDISSGLGSATNNAKEFKKQIMGFDEINNIMPPTSSSGGGGGGSTGIGPVDSALFDAMKEWDNQMSDIKSKAEGIRDKMLEWLGFHRKDDGGWELNDGLTRFGKILDVVKAIGVAIGTWTITSTLAKLFATLTGGSMAKALSIAADLTLAITGFFVSYMGRKRLLDGEYNLWSIFEVIGGDIMSTLGIAWLLKNASNGKITFGNGLIIGLGITLAVAGFQVLTDGINKKDIPKMILGALELTGGIVIPIVANWGTIVAGAKKVGDALKTLAVTLGLAQARGKHMADSVSLLGTTAGKTAVGIAGLTVAVVSLVSSYKDAQKTVEDMNSGGSKLETTFNGVGRAIKDALGAGAGGAITGTAIGGFGLGTVIGGIVGAVSSLGTTLYGLITGEKQLTEESKKVVQSQIEVNAIVEKATEIYDSAQEMYSKYVDSYKEKVKVNEDSLQSVFDETTQVKSLTSQLKEMVDVNGRVKQGYEDRVDIILGELTRATGIEFTRTDDLISKNGEIITSYQEIEGEIDKYIAQIEKSAKIEYLKSGYTEAIKARDDLIKTRRNLQEQADAIEEQFNKLDNKTGEEASKLSEQYVNLIDQINQIDGTIHDNEETIRTFAYNMTALTTEYTQEQEELFQQMKKNQEETTGQMLTTQEEATLRMKVMAETNSQEMLKIYDSATQEQKEQLILQMSTVDTYSPEVQKRWADMAKNSSERFTELIADVPTSVKAQILTSITTTEGMSPALSGAWSELGSSSYLKFKETLAEVEPETRAQILATMATTEGFQEQFVSDWVNLADTSAEEYEKYLSQVPESTRNEIKSAVDKVHNERKAMSDAIDSISRTFEPLKNTKVAQAIGNEMDAFKRAIDNKKSSISSTVGAINSIIRNNIAPNLYSTGWNTGSGLVQGLNDKINSVKNAVSNVASTILNTFKNALNINSPSRVMAEMGGYVTLGIAQGIDKESDSVYETMKEISKGIEISAKDMSFENLLGIDKEVQENVKVQAIGTVDLTTNVKENIAEIFENAMSNITVTVEAKTEEGVIVKKAVQGIRDYQARTGELPFDVLA